MKKEYKRYLQRITGAYKRKTPKLTFQGFSRILVEMAGVEQKE